MFIVKLESSNCKKLLFTFCKAQLIEPSAKCFSAKFSNSAQAYMMCRVLWFALSIKGKTLATFLSCCLCCVCESLVRSRGVCLHTHLGYQDQNWCQELGDHFNCCIKSLKKNTSRSTCGCCESKKEVVRGLGAVTWSWY